MTTRDTAPAGQQPRPEALAGSRPSAVHRAAAVFLPGRGGAAGDAPLSERGWRNSVVGLHVTFLLVMAIGIVLVLIQQDPVGPRIWSVGAMVVLAVAYVFAGAPAIAHDANGRAVTYLVVLVLAMGVIAATTPGALFLMFLAYVQVWFLVESPLPGIIWTALLALSTALGLTLSASLAGESTAFAWASSAISFLFSVLMGVWVFRVLEQSRQRADLIDALENTRAELAAAHREQGAAAERERLAREVHDTLAQGYTSIVMLARTAASQLDVDPAVARERLDLIEEVARENLAEARGLVAALEPVALGDSTLVQAVRRVVERFGRETGAEIGIDLPGQLTLARDREVVLLRAAQELLANVRRHAGAHRVQVVLTDGEQVRLTVTDDGVGFDPTRPGGNGLAGLRTRLAEVDGTLVVSSEPGRGSTVIATVLNRS